MSNKIVKCLKNVKHSIPNHGFWTPKEYIKLFALNFLKNYVTGEKYFSINEKIHEQILAYIDKNLSQDRLIQHSCCNKVKDNLDDKTIWVCWFQGENAMPPIVRVCYEQLKKYSNGHPVVLITLANLSEYLDISPQIMAKVGNDMPLTPFSDYIRLNLLSFYGGLWIDSTFLVTQPLDETIFDQDFFSIKNNNKDNSIVCRYNWAVNFVYCRKNYIPIQHIRNLFSAFWQKSEKSLNYLFIDYCFEYERLKNPLFDKTIVDMPFSNEDSHEIRLHFNEPFEIAQWNKWLSASTLFKLTYKGNLEMKTKAGKETYYGHVLKLQ